VGVINVLGWAILIPSNTRDVIGVFLLLPSLRMMEDGLVHGFYLQNGMDAC
jgi:hypothetical protein